MDDEEFLISLQKQYDEKTHDSSIRMIADEIYAFLDQFYIELNPLEQERLCLYLVHYRDSKKAAEHIIHINSSMCKIADGVNKIARIIDEKQALLLEEELVKQSKAVNLGLKEAILDTSFEKKKDAESVQKRKRKISSIQSFIKTNKVEKESEDSE